MSLLEYRSRSLRFARATPLILPILLNILAPSGPFVYAHQPNERKLVLAGPEDGREGLLSGSHVSEHISVVGGANICTNPGWSQNLNTASAIAKEDAGAVEHSETDSRMVRRQSGEMMVLENNTPLNKDITPGQTQHWLIPSQVLNAPAGEAGDGLPGSTPLSQRNEVIHSELKRQSDGRTVWVTINVCTQPSPRAILVQGTTPPALRVYVSQDQANRQPGPSSTGVQEVIEADGGYAMFDISAEQEFYVGVAALNTTNFFGSWNYEIGASIDAPYHQVELEKPFLHFVDADNHAALLITDNLTSANANDAVYQQWMELSPPYGIFAQDQTDARIHGVRRSYCGLSNTARIIANQQGTRNQNVATMTNRGKDGKPKEQFYLTALNASSQYWGFLAMQGNSTAHGQGVIGGGGKVWPAINFTTKAESNCALMYNLSFCSEVAYAVPTNPELFSPRGGLPQLSAIYDDYASQIYQNFNYSLQQIPCNTTATAQYSLARTCDDCAAAYKQWLCAVTIPRCEDFTNDRRWLQARNVAQPFPNGTTLPLNDGNTQALLQNVATNSSRSPVIDEQIRPGPYKEVLPCEDLCYDLVKACPAALGFGCPKRGAWLNNSYGFRSDDNGQITCSYLGAAYYLSGATERFHPRGMMSMVVLWVWALFIGMMAV